VRHLDQAISRNLAILFSTVSGIRDGQSDAIHDARVATRRLRAALPLAWADSPNASWESGFESIRKWGKHLGRVREADVALELLPSLEARVPPAAPAIAEVRLRVSQQQAKQRRQLVKSLDKLSLDRLRAVRLVPARGISLRVDGRWRSVERAIVEHSENLREAVDFASGIYFPNRSHRVRVATKKLRYVLELVDNPASTRMVKLLRRSQEILGLLHDHQVLATAVSSAQRLEKDHRRVLLASLEGRCEELFREYLTRRSQLLDVAQHARTAAIHGDWRPRSVGGMLLTASAVAVPSAFFWIARPSVRGGTPTLVASRDRRRPDAEYVSIAAVNNEATGGDLVNRLAPAASS
jgi:CHAD domain-containing protein